MDQPKNLKINLSDSIGMEEGYAPTIVIESRYLLISNREKVTDLLNNFPREENNIIDILISLHIVLEVGINSFFRDLAAPLIKKYTSFYESIKHLDDISFIDKTKMLLYYSKFAPNTDWEKANKHHGIINKLKRFSESRNKLLHGHAISVSSGTGKQSVSSEAKKKLDQVELENQIGLFKEILEGMRFFVDSLDIDNLRKEHLKNEFLTDSFLSPKY